jgi:tetratricopeptide (TPR) repeat protein
MNNMRKSFELILCFTCFLQFASWGQDKQSLIAQGDKYLETKNYAEVINTYSKIIILDSTQSEYYFKRGKAYFFSQDDTKALIDFDKAITLDNSSSQLFFMRGQVRNILNDKAGAISDYGSAIELDSNYVLAYIQRGFVFIDQGKLDAALVHFTIALNRNPNQSADVYFSRGYCYQNQSFNSQAIQDYKKAIEINSKHIEAYLNCGNVYLQTREYDKAIETYGVAIKLDPKIKKMHVKTGNKP